MSYDAWKTQDGGERLARGNGAERDFRLRCAGCGFTGELSAAVDHHIATGHVLTYRGNMQNFDRILRERATLAQQ